MRPEKQPERDWRDAATYAPLLDADRSVFAWEWLRRDPAYEAAALDALEGQGSVAGGSGPSPDPGQWGLHDFEHPHAGAPIARPMWRAEAWPYVLAVKAEKGGDVGDSFDLRRLRPLATLQGKAGENEHLLLSDGLRVIRLDVIDGSLQEGAVRLRYSLAGIASVAAPLLTLRRLIELWRRGRFSASLHRPEARAERWIMMLRAHDAIASGAGQREIAAELFNPVARAPGWRSEAPSVRSQVQRLVRSARLTARKSYRAFLLAQGS